MITAMILEEGKISLTSGDHNSKIIHCEEEGNINIVWRSGGPDTAYLMEAGADRVLSDKAKYFTIVDGVFTIS